MYRVFRLNSMQSPNNYGISDALYGVGACIMHI